MIRHPCARVSPCVPVCPVCVPAPKVSFNLYRYLSGPRCFTNTGKLREGPGKGIETGIDEGRACEPQDAPTSHGGGA